MWIPEDEAQPTLITKNITANGTYNAASDNADGFSAVVVNVPTSGGNLGTKTITANGTYNASADNYDGYSTVTVNVDNSEAVYASLLAQTWGSTLHTNTHWVFNDTITFAEGSYDVNFIDGFGNSNMGITIGQSEIYYTSGNSTLTVYSVSWNYRQTGYGYKYITLTGGDDIEDANFLTWLTANATQYTPVADLTNTTWDLNSSLSGFITLISYSGTYRGDYSVNFTAGGNTYSALTWYDTGELWYGSTVAYNGTWSTNNTITITGGTDVTNAELINWLYGNGVKQ